MKASAIVLAAAFAAPAASALSGTYTGSVPFILNMKIVFPGDGTMNFDQNVKVASVEVKCPTEKIAETDAQITFPETGSDGDCMGDALRGQSKDPSKFLIDINADGSLTFKSDGWPNLKLKKGSSILAAPAADTLSGAYEGSVPFIIDVNGDDEPASLGAGAGGKIFLDGFISGFIGKATHIKKCVVQSEHLVGDAAGLIADLKARKFNQTIHHIEALVQDVGAELPSCKGAGEDLKPILEAFKGVHSIKDLMQKLKTNFLAHDHEFLDILEDELQACTFGKPDAHQCGLDVGKQVRSLMVGDQLSSPMVTGHGKIFMEGFIEGFIGKAEHIKACIAQSVKTEKAGVKFITDIKARKFNRTISDVQALIGDVTADLSTCKGAVQDLGPILAAFKGVHNIKDFMNKIKQNFLAHDKEFLDILDDMIEVCTFGAPDAHKCGKDLGRQSRIFVIGDQSAVLV